MFPNIVQSEQEWHIIWNPCQIACPPIPVIWILGQSFLRYEGLKVGNCARFCRNSQSLGGHISHTTGPIDLKFWIWCCGFPNNMYSRTPLIRPPSESHWCGRIRGMVAREGFVYEQKPLSVTRNVVVWEGWSLVRVVVCQGFYCIPNLIKIRVGRV